MIHSISADVVTASIFVPLFTFIAKAAHSALILKQKNPFKYTFQERKKGPPNLLHIKMGKGDNSVEQSSTDFVLN